MTVVHGNFRSGQCITVFIWQCYDGFSQFSLFITETVVVAIVSFHDCFQVVVNRICSTRSVHPTSVLVETLVDEELSPGHCAVCVQALFTDHV